MPRYVFAPMAALLATACSSAQGPTLVVVQDASGDLADPPAPEVASAAPGPGAPAARTAGRGLVSEGLLPTNFRVYAAGGAVINHPAEGFSERELSTTNEYMGPDGCYVACYSHDADGAAYDVGGGIYVKGQVRVRGGYEARICRPNGFERADISAAPVFKALCAQNVESCRAGECWAGGDTGGWFGLQEESGGRACRSCR